MVTAGKRTQANAIINGKLDEELYQELCMTLMQVIKLFKI